MLKRSRKLISYDLRTLNNQSSFFLAALENLSLTASLPPVYLSG